MYRNISTTTAWPSNWWTPLALELRAHQREPVRDTGGRSRIVDVDGDGASDDAHVQHFRVVHGIPQEPEHELYGTCDSSPSRCATVVGATSREPEQQFGHAEQPLYFQCADPEIGPAIAQATLELEREAADPRR